MKHTEETIRAAEEYAKKYKSLDMSAAALQGHLAGYEKGAEDERKKLDFEKQLEATDLYYQSKIEGKDQQIKKLELIQSAQELHIQELVEALEDATDTARRLLTGNEPRNLDMEVLKVYDKLIQKFKKV